MNRNYLYKLSQLVLMVTFILGMTGCDEGFVNLFSEDISEGEEVMFSTSIPRTSVTRSAKSDYETAMGAYKAVNEAYEFTVGMYTDDGSLIGTSVYQPVAGDKMGTLATKEGETPLYWNSTTVPYGFKASAGSETLNADQSIPENWLLQDRLEGYGYIQKWEGDEETGNPIDRLDAMNYHTAKLATMMTTRRFRSTCNTSVHSSPLY